MTKLTQHKTLKSITQGKLTFGDRIVLYLVVNPSSWQGEEDLEEGN